MKAMRMKKFKNILKDISESILAEVIWNIVIFIPRIIVRMWKHFY